MNSFIHLAKQMGIIENTYYDFLPNSTKCKTIDDVYQSHVETNTTVIVEVNDIYGMLVLLSFGMGLALTTFSAEMVYLVCISIQSLSGQFTSTCIFVQKGITQLKLMKRRGRDQKKAPSIALNDENMS